MAPYHHTQPGTFIRWILSLSGLMARTLLAPHMTRPDAQETPCRNPLGPRRTNAIGCPSERERLQPRH